MLKTYSVLSIAFLLSFSTIHAQGLFKDDEGESSILLPTSEDNAFDLKFTSATSKFSLAFSRNRPAFYDNTNTLLPTQSANRYYRWLMAGSIDFSAKEGIGKLLSGKKPKAEIGGSFNAGENILRLLRCSGGGAGAPAVINCTQITHSIFGSFEAHYSKLRLLGQSIDPADLKITDINLFTTKSLFHYNLNYKGHKDRYLLFFGFSTGYAFSNNEDDLDDVRVDTIQAVGNGKSVISSEEIKSGILKQYHTIPFNVDIAISPRVGKQNMLGINAYFRSELLPKPKMNAGLGIYLSKRNAPTEVVGGLAYQFNDISNTGDSDESIFKRNVLFFYIGYTLPF
jgi:hypothetical protein